MKKQGRDILRKYIQRAFFFSDKIFFEKDEEITKKFKMVNFILILAEMVDFPKQGSYEEKVESLNHNEDYKLLSMLYKSIVFDKPKNWGNIDFNLDELLKIAEKIHLDFEKKRLNQEIYTWDEYADLSKDMDFPIMTLGHNFLLFFYLFFKRSFPGWKYFNKHPYEYLLDNLNEILYKEKKEMKRILKYKRIWEKFR